MRIAIIGSGVSGLTSAYLLSPHHKVTVYEKDSRLGGHAHTLFVGKGTKKIAVDNGFMVYNPQMYPNFIGLLDELGVESLKTNMSFGVNIPDQISYRINLQKGVFIQKDNLLNTRYWRFLYEVLRFRRIAKQALQSPHDLTENLDTFLKKHNFSEDLASWFLYPMLCAIWSVKDSDRIGDFPTMATLTFLNNHRLLSNTQPRWRTIKGGSTMYVSKVKSAIEKNGAKIVLNSKITHIKRSNDSVTIKVNDKQEVFDYVIFATHADTAKELITDISDKEKAALGKFEYSDNTTILHGDTRLAPQTKNLLAAWNYAETPTNNPRRPGVTFTYCMNILQHIPDETPVFVTLNPHAEINESVVYAREEYTHPQYSVKSLAGQAAIAKLQGKNRTYFVGAHLGYGFHEDGINSAINVAKHLGITPTWQNQI